MIRSHLFHVVVAGLMFMAGCRSHQSAQNTITLATTTSTRDSGLLDELVPLFEAEHKVQVKVVAVGTGQALAIARRGDADVLLTHAPAAENEFVAEGYGIQRQLVMHNDFVIVGPPGDPANLAQANSAADALHRIADKRSMFVSRGDESGTHIKEGQLWQLAGIDPKGDWYLRGGAGMSQTLRMADEKRAYALTDRGTFLAQRETLSLNVAVEGDRLLRNQYAVIVVNPDKHPNAKHHDAERFALFLLADRIQEKIAKFGVEEFGEPLFYRTTKEESVAQ